LLPVDCEPLGKTVLSLLNVASPDVQVPQQDQDASSARFIANLFAECQGLGVVLLGRIIFLELQLRESHIYQNCGLPELMSRLFHGRLCFLVVASRLLKIA
jgi:hypothetical protein